LALEQLSDKTVKYVQPYIVEIRGPVVQHGNQQDEPLALFPALTSAEESGLSSTSSAGEYYHYQLNLDGPATEQQNEPSYLEMGLNTRKQPSTVSFQWYYLVIVPTDQSHFEWKRLGLLTVSSRSQKRPLVVCEEHRVIKLT
jgi:hypothetical protein